MPRRIRLIGAAFILAVVPLKLLWDFVGTFSSENKALVIVLLDDAVNESCSRANVFAYPSVYLSTSTTAGCTNSETRPLVGGFGFAAALESASEFEYIIVVKRAALSHNAVEVVETIERFITTDGYARKTLTVWPCVGDFAVL
jgi:hypothetical protein